MGEDGVLRAIGGNGKVTEPLDLSPGAGVSSSDAPEVTEALSGKMRGYSGVAPAPG